jgi:hypothetical protein
LVPPVLYASIPVPDGRAQAIALTRAGMLTATAGLLAFWGVLRTLAETRRANENTHVRELYVEAVKLLSDDDVSIRVGGLYALERVAKDSPGAQPTVVDVLSAFVRERSTYPLPVGD